MPFDSDIVSISPGGNTPPTPAPADQQPPQQANPVTVQDQHTQAPQIPIGSPAQAQPAQPQNTQQQIVSNQPPADPDANHPAVKRGNLIYRAAQALSGGPRYAEKILDDGTRVRTPLPISAKSIGLAIAMEAISGGLAGAAAGRGKGMGAAGFAGFRQVQQQRQEADDREDQQAQADFTNKASAYAANLRTRALAQEIGERDENAHKAWIAQHAGTVNYIRENASNAIVKDAASESEIKDPAFTKEALARGYIAIPTGTTPRFDSNGSHYSKDGVPLHDNTYLVVDPTKLDSGRLWVSPDLLSKAQAWSLPGFTNRNGEPIRGLEDMELRLGTVVDTTNKISSLEQEQRDLNDYYGYLNSKNVKGPDGKPLTAPDLKQLIKQNPTLINSITGAWQNHFAESPSAALRAMKDSVPGKGAIANLYGGAALLNQYDTLQSTDKKTTEKSAEAAVDIDKERKLIPIKAAAAGAEARAREQASQPGNLSDNEIVNGMLDGSVDITKTASIRGNQRERYIALAKQKDPTFNMQTYQNRLKTSQAFTPDGKMGQQIISLNTFTGHVGDASDLVNSLRNTNSPWINKPLNEVRKALGNDKIAPFDTAILAAKEEYANFLKGGHAPLSAEQQELADKLNDSQSPAQMQATLKQMAKTVLIRANSINGAYKAVMNKDYPYMLNSDSVTVLNNLGFGQQASRFNGSQSAQSQQSAQPVPPAGATMKVPGSDGKMHWSDGKTDLGVVQ